MIFEFRVYTFLNSSVLKVEQELIDPFINSAPTQLNISMFKSGKFWLKAFKSVCDLILEEGDGEKFFTVICLPLRWQVVVTKW